MEEKHDDQLAGKTWAGQFGKDYTDRCTFSPEELDSLYKREYGISREEMNTRFLSGLGLENKENFGSWVQCWQSAENASKNGI